MQLPCMHSRSHCQSSGSSEHATGLSVLLVGPPIVQGMGYAVDKKTNTAVFGAEATPQAILSGSVNSPPAMQQLYTALAEVRRAALCVYVCAGGEAGGGVSKTGLDCRMP